MLHAESLSSKESPVLGRKPPSAWSELMLTMGGVVSARKQRRSSLGFRGEDKEGAFLRSPGDQPREKRVSRRESTAHRAAATRGRPCTPSRRRPAGLDLLTWLPAASPTCRSRVPPLPASHPGLGSRMGPLGVISHSWSLPSTWQGLRKREPLPDVWEMTSEFNQIILA